MTLSIRWWLPLAFTAIAAATAATVGVLLNQRAEQAFRARTHQIAVGDAVAAASAIQGSADGRADIPAIARNSDLALFVVSYRGALRSAPSSNGLAYSDVPHRRDAVDAVRGLRRYVAGTRPGGTVVGLRLPAVDGVLVAYRPRSSAAAEAALVRRELWPSALLAATGGALVGVALSSLISRRIRRISQTAEAIERGDFTRRLETSANDEIGTLARAIDQMQVKLRDSFATLEYERDRLQRIFERLHDGVIAVELGGVVAFANPTARNFAGDEALRPGDPLPEPWPELELRPLVAEAARASSALERRFEHGGRTFDLVALAPNQDHGTVVLVLTDVSERERRERAEREFVANAAHELRTPVAAILASVEALQDGARADPTLEQRFLDHIEREARRLSRLSAAMLTLARAQTGAEAVRLSRVELCPLLAEAIDSVDFGDGQVHLSCHGRAPVTANADLAYHLFTNLLANAARHARRAVRVDVLEQPRGTLVQVCDDGPGIDATAGDRIFERFFRAGGRGSEGFGLGLAIVREVTAALGGEVAVRGSSVGTVVEVVIPTWVDP